MRKLFLSFCALAFCASCAVSDDSRGLDPLGPSSDRVPVKETKVKRLGALTPIAALNYMKKTPDLVIVEVNTDYWKLKTGFIGAMHIPHDEMEKRYNEIPAGVPVILHCGAGAVAPSAYETLSKLRPDIPELSYIAGSPLILEYNEWYRSTHK